MANTYTKNYVHIVFSTKYRQPWITDSLSSIIFRYVAGTCNALDCPVVTVGGYLDHIHILCALSKNITLSTLVKEIKSSSSKFVKRKFPGCSGFYWQTGFAAFSVDYWSIDKIQKYINTQKEHHQKTGFKEEYRKFLEENNMPYQEEYLF